MNVTIEGHNEVLCSFEMRHLKSGEPCKPDFDENLFIAMRVQLNLFNSPGAENKSHKVDLWFNFVAKQ